ncbi:MAG TPA: hypothetical protein VMW16_13945 [Sedimentisphaerales bacterium]|nr:hypothetical protein [Sedimentisphaerales bacterium]
MKRIFVCGVIAFLTVVSADGKEGRKDGGSKASEPVELTLYPARAPEPKDKYRLLPKPEEMSDLDGVPLYEKAVESLPKNAKDISRWRGTPPQELPIKQVQAELKRFEPSLKLVEQAARCSKCKWPAVQTGAMPANLDKYRMIAPALALQARLDIAEKKYDRALHTMQTGLGMARHIADGPTLIHGLLGTAVGALVLKQAEQLIQAPDSPNLYWALESLPKPLIDLTKQMQDEIANIESQYRNPVTRMAMKRQLEPAHERVRVLTKKLNRQVAALQCIEALRLHADAHDGKFPNQLSDVTEVSVPVDPLSGRPFVYRRTDSELVLEAVLPETARPEDALEYKLTLKE